jgi:hypothetical protein
MEMHNPLDVKIPSVIRLLSSADVSTLSCSSAPERALPLLLSSLLKIHKIASSDIISVS